MKKNYATYVLLLTILLSVTTYAQTPDFNLSVTNIVISENDRPLTNVSESISILYGGSVKPANAKEIFSKPDVDGGLIGGAALNVTDFTGIINAI